MRVTRSARVARVLVALGVLSMLALITRLADAWPPSRGVTILRTCADPACIRRELGRVADSLNTADPAAAADALYWRGLSEQRAGLADVAINDWTRAAELRGSDEEVFALADALLARRASGDLDRVIAHMRRGAASSDARYGARFAWALCLSGQADSALLVMRPLLPALAGDPTWNARFGRVALASGDASLALRWLGPAVVATRGADSTLRSALRAAAATAPQTHGVDLDPWVRTQVARREANERLAVESAGGVRLNARTADGASLAGALFAGPGREPAALVLMAPGDSLAGCDSLVAALRSCGVAVLLVERRGTGGSIGPHFALPEDIVGREDALEPLLARDGFQLLRSIAARVDTTRLLVVGSRESAATAILAATQNSRVRALLLVSVDPPPTEVGRACARLHAMQLPIFIQMAPEDLDLPLIADALYQSGRRGNSRVADCRAPGRGAEIFRMDPTIVPRLRQWLKGALATPRGRSAPPPARRKG